MIYSVYANHSGIKLYVFQLCIVINDVEQVRRALMPLPLALSFSNQCKQGTSNGEEEILQEVLRNADRVIETKIKQVADHVADKVYMPMKYF